MTIFHIFEFIFYHLSYCWDLDDDSMWFSIHFSLYFKLLSFSQASDLWKSAIFVLSLKPWFFFHPNIARESLHFFKYYQTLYFIFILKFQVSGIRMNFQWDSIYLSKPYIFAHVLGFRAHFPSSSFCTCLGKNPLYFFGFNPIENSRDFHQLSLGLAPKSEVFHW